MERTSDNCRLFEGVRDPKNLARGFEYTTPMERHLIKYVLTRIFEDKPPMIYGRASDFTNAPPLRTIATGYDQTAQVLDNAFALYPNLGIRFWEAQTGSQTITLYVDILAKDEATLMEYVGTYKKYVRKHNFYQGKTLKFTREGLEFMPDVHRSWESVVFDDAKKEDILLNTVKFLTDTRYHEITTKRGILMEGPPGTGKTSMIKAIFTKLQEVDTTRVYLSDECFHSMSVDVLLKFFDTYLAPGVLVFEDIDTIGESRESTRTGIMGSLLTAFNGINDLKHPVTMIATTNRVEVLDQALTRPQRFDRKITFDYPEYDILEGIFKRRFGFDPPKTLRDMYETGKNVKEDAKYKNTQLTGAHIEDMYCNAHMLALERDSTITECLEDAMNLTKENFVVSIGNQSATCGFGFGGGSKSSKNSEGDQPKPATLTTISPSKKQTDSKEDLPKDPGE